MISTKKGITKSLNHVRDKSYPSFIITKLVNYWTLIGINEQNTAHHRHRTISHNHCIFHYFLIWNDILLYYTTTCQLFELCPNLNFLISIIHPYHYCSILPYDRLLTPFVRETSSLNTHICVSVRVLYVIISTIHFY